MKLRKLGQVVLAAVVGLGCSFGMVSCVQSHTVGYFYVTGHQYNQVGAFKITNNTGNITAAGKLVGSGGVNPIDAITAQAGKFLYVLNSGCADPALYPNAKFPCASGETPSPSTIELFTIGGNGVLTAQQSYSSQGLNSVSISLDSSGNYLYVLDQNTPNSPSSFTPAQYANDGDVSVFAINASTGRLSPQQNLQIQNTNKQQLLFFPVGQDPVWFRVFSSYLFTIDRNNGSTPNASFVNAYSTNATGQLIQTQNSEFPTGATNLTYISSGGSYLYLLDAGTPNVAGSSLTNGAIYAYTVNGGALASVVGGAITQASLGYTTSFNPTVLLVDSTSKFVYVANTGLNQAISEAASNISSYFINSNGVLTTVAGTQSGTNSSGTGASPRCLIEDPSNQYLFTANYNDNTVTGKILNTEAGILSPQRGTATTKTGVPGQPTWCVASGNTF